MTLLEQIKETVRQGNTSSYSPKTFIFFVDLVNLTQFARTSYPI